MASKSATKTKPGKVTEARMQLWDPRGAPTLTDREVYEELLPLKDAEILELGCGKADISRAIATAERGATITALEVDTAQHALNLESPQLPNLQFALGGAEKIPARDDQFDVVMMFKSLHHVPAELMDQALREVRRVLKPGGLAYIAEPVFSGAFNEILRVFHDEEQARLAAFAAITKAIAKGGMELVVEKFFFTITRIADFAAFEQRYINVTHTTHHLSKAQRAEVEKRFAQHMGGDGAVFKMPMRVDVLRKTDGP
jgi:ubiquinone/menaquinone biosynthesis C-methylase UbiE